MIHFMSVLSWPVHNLLPEFIFLLTAARKASTVVASRSLDRFEIQLPRLCCSDKNFYAERINYGNEISTFTAHLMEAMGLSGTLCERARC